MVEPRIKKISCPNCGGIIANYGQRIIKCKYCGSRSLLVLERYEPSYYLKPSLEKNEARRKAIELFKDPKVPRNLIREARLESINLLFIPIYELRARRVGTFSSIQSEYEKAWIQKQMFDTRVIINDIVRSYPAVDLTEFGIEEIDLNEARDKESSILYPYKREELEKIGKVFTPRISSEQRINQIFNRPDMKGFFDNTEIVEQNVSLIYYPIYRIKYRYQGRIYSINIDAITSKILSARAPVSDRGRILSLLLTACFFGMVVGKLLKVIGYFALKGKEFIFALIQASIFFPPFFLFIGLILIFFIAVGWDRFRYSREMIIEGKKRREEMINRPPNAFSDRVFELISRISDKILKKMKQRYD